MEGTDSQKLSASDPLYEPVRRANWAQKKIVEFHLAVNSWVTAKPYAHIIEKNENTGFIEHKLRLVKPLSPYIGDHFGDAIQALRSSLDLLMSSIAFSRHKGLSGIGFPFGSSVSELESEMKKRKIHRRLGQPAVDLLRRIEPYQGGDKLLFALNQLNNSHKHRKGLKPRGNVVFGGLDFKSTGTGQVEFPNQPWVDDEVVFFRFTGDETFYLKMQIVPQIFLEGLDLPKDQPAIVVLLQMLQRIAEITSEFRAAYFPS